MSGFVKIYGDRLLRSTLWMEPWQPRLVFLGMLAMADAKGIVDVPSVEVLAHALNLPPVDVQAGLDILEAPDPGSRSPEEGGRRVIREGSVWRIVNYEKYREYRTEAQEARAEATRKWRAKKATCGSHGSRPITSDTEAEAEAEAENPPIVPPGGQTEIARGMGMGLEHVGQDPKVEAVLAAMTTAVQQLEPGRTGPRDTATNRKAIRRPMRECDATVDDWRTVIARQLKSVRHDRSKWKYLSLQTLGVPKNFQRLLDGPEPTGGPDRGSQASFIPDGTETFGEGRKEVPR